MYLLNYVQPSWPMNLFEVDLMKRVISIATSLIFAADKLTVKYFTESSHILP